MGLLANEKIELKDIFVLDTNDYVHYVDINGKVYPDNSIALAIEPVGPIYTEDNIPDSFIPIYTIAQFNSISTNAIDYEIKNLNGISKGTFDMSQDATYVLMNDIDFSSISNLTPIKDFKGTFEGNRYSVKNINMDTSDSETIYTSVITGIGIDPPGGLFDRITHGEVNNLTIDNMKLTGIGSLGALMGENTGTTITSCKVINSTITNSGYSSSGGLIGFVNNEPITITNSKVISSKISGDNASGIIATSFGDLTINTCRVEDTSCDVAGLIGYTNGILNMTNCKSVKNTAPLGMIKLSIGNTTLTNCESSNIVASFAGIINESQGRFIANNCKVLNSTIDDTTLNGSNFVYGGNVAGIIAVANSSVELNLCEVNQTTLISGSNANIGGLVSFLNNSEQQAKITNSKFINSTVKNGGSNVGGILAISSVGLKIDTCSVDNIIFENTSDNVSGLVSYSSGPATITNSNFTNSTITNGSNAGGIVSVINSTLEVDNCNIQNINMNSISYASSGVVTISNGNTTIRNSNIKGINLLGGYNIGGAIAIINANLVMDNCNVENVSLNSSSYNYNAGGIISNLNGGFIISKCNVINMKASGVKNIAGGIVAISGYSDVGSFTNCKVQGLIVENDTVNSAGFIAVTNTPLTVDECSFIESSILSSDSAGGIVAIARNNDSIITNSNISNNTIVSSNAAGIAAFTDKLEVLNCNISKCSITNALDNHSIISGIVCQPSNNSTIKNITISDSNLKSNTFMASGIVSLGSNIKIDDCTIIRTNITSGEILGGIVGIFDSSNPSEYNINNCKIISSTLTNNYIDNYKSYFAGGITAISNGPIINCDIVNSTIISNNIDAEYVKIGGISGMSSASPIKNCNISDSIITSKKANIGGISGFGYNISDCIVMNTNITDTNTSSITATTDYYISLNALGGIVGHGNNYNSVGAILTGCKVIDSNLSGCDAIGGISGAANPNIANCEVTGSNMIGSGKFVGGIQGFGGSLSESNLAVTINNCSLKNSKLIGISSVNYILGHNSYYPIDSTVPLENRHTDLIINCINNNNTIN